MPSPFPGMEPYLEAADIWPDFHDRFADHISGELNRRLPAPYYARLESRRDEARTEISKSVEIVVPSESIRHLYIEVRDSKRSHKLVTLIEIDLLRDGQPVVGGMFVADAFINLDPPADYLIDVNRAWQRGTKAAHQLFPIGLRDMLPCIPVPLRDGEDEVPLDLQYVFRHAYDAGPYRRGAIDYAEPCDPPLEGDDAMWADQLLQELKRRTE